MPLNPSLGFGSQPFGTTSIGLGTPVGLPLPGNGYETVDDLVPVRALDLVTLDYQVDDTTDGSPHAEWTAMEQAVALALTTPANTLPFALSFGDPTLALEKMPADPAGTARALTEKALYPLTSAGQVRILDVTVSAAGNVLYRTVRWLDVTANATRTTTGPLT